MAVALLDVDGTLADTNYLHTVAWSRAFRDAGECVPMWMIHRRVGMGADRLIDDLVAGERADLEAAWDAHYEKLKPDVRLLPGARELVEALDAHDVLVVLATSGQEDDVAHVRELLDAEQWIHAVVNSSEVGASKPAPDIFRLALERAGAAAEDAVVVGDTVWDVLAATACHLPCIGVETGGVSGAELRLAGARAVYRDVAEVRMRLDDAILSRFRPR